MKEKKVKSIGGFELFKTTVGGLKMLQRVYVFRNGIIRIEDYIQVPNKEVEQAINNGFGDIKKVNNKFGYTVFLNTYSSRIETLQWMVSNGKKVLSENGVKLSDLV